MQRKIAIVHKPKDKTLREKGVVMALSLDYNISAIGNNPNEAVTNLISLVSRHIKNAKEKQINPLIGSESGYKMLGKHYSEHSEDPSEVRCPGENFSMLAYSLTHLSIE